MNKYNLAGISFISIIFLINLVNATQTCQIYDDFSSQSLDTNKWDVRQDYEGWPFTNEYGLDTNSQNFHTKQNNVGGAGTFLVPTHKFSTGESFEYDINYNSGSGNRVSMLLVNNVNRMGIVGYWNGPENSDFGTYHVEMTFGDGFIDQIIRSPDGTESNRHDLIGLNENHELYIGVRTGHNGLVDIDYDNFRICNEEEEPSLEKRVEVLEQKVEELENRVSILEVLIDKIKHYFWFMPTSIKKNILCWTLEDSRETEIEDFGLKCELKQLWNRNKCVCKRI